MSPTAAALLGYVAWTLLLLVSLGATRTFKVMAGGRAANSFSASGDDMDGFGKRLTRAHANCYENLPIAGAVMLYAIAASQTSLTDDLAFILLAGRIAQSITHVISTTNTFVLIRFVFFIIQIVVIAIWLLKLFSTL